ncbi:MAG: hypothetical protein LBL66_05935 [Clostridiales bacterium]|nr:hypothetical protein [Clostridiales bacterium]
MKDVAGCEKPRIYRNKIFIFCLPLGASTIAAAAAIVWFFPIFEYTDSITVSCIFGFMSLWGYGLSAVVIVNYKRYVKYCRHIYEYGEVLNAEILGFGEKRATAPRSRRIYSFFAVYYRVATEQGNVEKRTSYIFTKDEIERYKNLGSFKVCYDKRENTAIYLR